MVWQRAYGSSSADAANAVTPGPEGGHVVAGSSEGAAFALALDAGGEPRWRRRYSVASSISEIVGVPGAGAGYIAVGTSATSGTDDLWLARLDANGQVLWQSLYGGEGTDLGLAVRPYGDGYGVLGYTESFGVERGFWLLLTDGDGEIVWQRAFSAGEDSLAEALAVDGDGQLVVGGTTFSLYGGFDDGWLLTLSPEGDLVSSRSYHRGDGWERIRAVSLSAGGELAVAGYAARSLAERGESQFGDFWVARVASNGEAGCMPAHALEPAVATTTAVAVSLPASEVVRAATVATVTPTELSPTEPCAPSNAGGIDRWARDYLPVLGDGDSAELLVPKPGGGYLLGGSVASFGEGGDLWLVEIDEDGIPVWQNRYGGAGTEVVAGAAALDDGGYVLAALSTSFAAGDTSSGLGQLWLVRLDTHGAVVWEHAYASPSPGAGLDTAVTVVARAAGGDVLVGGREIGGGWVLSVRPDGELAWRLPTGDAVFAGAACDELGCALVGSQDRVGSGADLVVATVNERGEVRAAWAYSGAHSASLERAEAVVGSGGGPFVVVGEHAPDGQESAGLLLTLAADGAIESQLTLPTPGGARLAAIDVAGDEGLLLAGGSRVIRAAPSGTLEWARQLDSGAARAVLATPDGGSLVLTAGYRLYKLDADGEDGCGLLAPVTPEPGAADLSSVALQAPLLSPLRVSDTAASTRWCPGTACSAPPIVGRRGSDSRSCSARSTHS